MNAENQNITHSNFSIKLYLDSFADNSSADILGIPMLQGFEKYISNAFCMAINKTDIQLLPMPESLREGV